MSQDVFVKGSFWSGLTGLLAGGCVFLAVVLLLQTLLLGQPGEVTVEERPLPEVDSDLRQVVLNDENLESYASILERPLFFPDRELPEIAGEESLEEDGPAESQVTELDARLTGVIITPDRRMAMVTDGKTSKTTVMREGMSLEGDQAAWQLSEISERSVSFAAGEMTAELELKVNTRGLQAPAVSATASNRAIRNAALNNNSATQNNAASPAVNSAAEVRRRIAERRAKLRAAREQQAQNQAQEEN